VIELNRVSKVFSDGFVALANVSLKIEKGEFAFVVGPSGAGKSTLIKMLFREELATEGEIIVNGRNLTELTPKEVPYFRRSLGIVFQDFRLLPDKNCYENVAFAMRVVEAPRREIQRRVKNALDLVGLLPKAKIFPAQLSGGEQQRVAVARAIVNSPAVVIADEPTGNLDPDNSWEIMKIFDRISRAGTTVLMATHDKPIVDQMMKRVIALEDGRIVRDDSRGTYGYED
jgi:cell division transport system ATP-binding protein